MLAQGFVQNFSGLLATRFMLGLAEAGVFPGSFYLISFWYKREESLMRFTFFWCSVLVASMFGGLLASAIANMDGLAGLANWRWIFILEGLGTIAVAGFAYFFVLDFPDEAKWLTEEEREFVKKRAGIDAEAVRPIEMRDIAWFFKDLKRILGAFMYFGKLLLSSLSGDANEALGIVVPVYAYAYFAPTIIKSLGFSVVQTQLRSVPPVAVALVLCVIVSWWSDLVKIRLPFVAFGLLMTVAGLAVLMTIQHDFPVQYGALCLVAMGAFSAGVVIVCWYVMNLHGHIERSIGTAWMISFGNTGGIIATFTFVASDAPYYFRGYAICMGAICLSILSTIIYSFLVWKENRSSSSTLEGETEERKEKHYIL